MIRIVALLSLISFLFVACNSATVTPSTLTDYYQSIDFSCTTDADCIIKDVHNCCGYFPQCVNKNYQTNPTLVDTLCKNEEVFSTCGYQEVTSCGCVEGRCVDNV